MTTEAPKRSAEEIARGLVEAAARVLAEEGPGAVSARRLATEVGTSTMAVYTHFGSMDQVLVHVRREGFRRFTTALDRSTMTDDPVADWMEHGWVYRRFALDEPHLYQAMFGDLRAHLAAGTQEDTRAAFATYLTLRERIERCHDAGRWHVPDADLATEIVWATIHGLAALALTGYFERASRDSIAAHLEFSRRTAVGFGDDPDAVARSMDRARRRAEASHLV